MPSLAPNVPARRNRPPLSWACELLAEARVALETAQPVTEDDSQTLARIDAMLSQAAREIEVLVVP